jgi:hypothetical protein
VTSENVDDELKRAVTSTQEENRRLRAVLTDLEDKETELQVSEASHPIVSLKLQGGAHISGKCPHQQYKWCDWSVLLS